MLSERNIAAAKGVSHGKVIKHFRKNRPFLCQFPWVLADASPLWDASDFIFKIRQRGSSVRVNEEELRWARSF